MWDIKKLGEICDFQGGSQPPKKEFIYELKKGYIRFLQIRDFKSDKNITYIPIAKKNKLCKEDDILIGRYGASVGQILRGLSGAHNVALMKTIPNEKVISKGWLYAYLSSSLFQQPLITVSSRSAQNGFSKDDIYDFSVPIPPLEIQDHIVKKIENTFTKIEKAKILVNKENSKYIELIKSVILSKLESVERKHMQYFGDVCELVRGPFGGSLKKSIFINKGYAIYEQQHPINDQFNDFRYFISEDKFNEMKRFAIKENDLLMSCSGATLGKIGIVPPGAPKGIINQALLKISPKSEILAEYLQLIMRSDLFQKLIWSISGGAAQPNVPAVKIIKKLLLPVPSISEQNEILHWHQKLQINDLQNTFSKKIYALDKLKDSILSSELNYSAT